ncbi:SDR family NAD(P)-dependent oxidoreductase [Butyrivibrio sp. AE2015]|uniref:SDR family NAD(P)-dependent oxidoreductase n=1 Tax=Butyrivibrio sp. AE2015 TaxID=1280663 RepID=UPI0003B34613|nr:SDR family oxidoreductase [Butyrivibrio sp. AE2015]
MRLTNAIKKIIQWRNEKEIVAIEHIVSSDKQFEGKVALIIGGTGGIGYAIAKSLIESGCRVIIAGTNKNKIEEIVKEFGNQAKGCYINMNNIQDFNSNIKYSVDLFGKIDILINSAGVHTDNLNFWDLTDTEYDRVMNINLRGPYFFSIEIARYMIENNIKGHILFVSSSRGAEPAWSPYGISKWGINGMVKGLAHMLISNGIVVNGIAPGISATALIGMRDGDSIYTDENVVGRMVLPNEVAAVAKTLVGSSGDMIVGDIVHISGGRGVIDIR